MTHGNKDREDDRTPSLFSASALTLNIQTARRKEPVPPRNSRRLAAPRWTDKRNAEQRAPAVTTVRPEDMTVESAGGEGGDTTLRTVRATSSAAATRRDDFNVADTVIVMDKYGHPVDAVVVGVDNTVSPPLFKVSFKDRRKKEAWKTATELTASAGNTPALAGPTASAAPAAASAAAPAAPAPARAPPAAAAAAVASSAGNRSKLSLAPRRNGKRRKNENPAAAGRPRSRQQERIRHDGDKKADTPDILAPTDQSSGEHEPEASGEPSRAGIQSETSQALERSPDGDNGQKERTNNIGNNNNEETYAPRGRDAVSQQLPRRRAAAAAAAGAILSTSKSARRKRVNPLQQPQSTKKSHSGLPPGAGGQGQRVGEASPGRDAAVTTTTEYEGQIPRKLGLSGKKRPGVAAPSFAAAASLPVEPALRSELFFRSCV